MKRAPAIFFLILLLGSSLLATAATEAGESHATAHHFNWMAFFGKVLNSLILFGGLYLLLRKPMAAQLDRQSTDLRTDIEEREAQIRTNQASMADLQNRLRNLENELQAMKEAAASSGREQVEQLEAQGREETRRIIARSEAEIDLRVEAAVKQMKSRVADNMIVRFAAEFREQVDADAHNRLIERGIDLAETIDGR